MSNDENWVVELAITKTRSGELSPDALLWVIAASQLCVPTPDANYAGDLTQFVPLLLDRDGNRYLACFTTPTRMGRYRDVAPQFVVLLGADLMRMMPPDYGLVVNPETAPGFELPWKGLELFIAGMNNRSV